MKHLRPLVAAAVLAACVLPAAGQTGAGAARSGKKPAAGVEDVTVITSSRLTFDYNRRYAQFDEDVVVADPEMKMSADRLTVQFDADGQVTSIKAEGRVKITQADKVAESGVASYDVATGKIVLASKPRVRRGRDVLEGDVITFWRNENRMVCQPQARLVIYPEKGGMQDAFFGE